MIRRSPPGAIRVIGHTDSKGDDAYNQTLSEARANRVADWLREQDGVRQRELLVSGQGEAAPIAPNENAAGGANPAGRAKNRRVALVVPTTASRTSGSPRCRSPPLRAKPVSAPPPPTPSAATSASPAPAPPSPPP